MAQPRIFVSHSHEDNDFCRAFVRGLRERGLSVWYDEHDMGWGQLRQTIDKELQNSQHFIAILSPSSIQSDWVNMELDAALALLRKKKLQSFLLVVAKIGDIPVTLEGFRRLEGAGGKAIGVTEAVNRVVGIIHDSQPTPQPEPSVSPTLDSPHEPVASPSRKAAVVAFARAYRTRRVLSALFVTVGLLAGVATIAAVVMTFTNRSGQIAPQAAFTHGGPYGDSQSYTSNPDSRCVDFNASSSTGNSLTYSWDFSDIGPVDATATGVTATHCYSEFGTYNVTLTVTDSSGHQSVDEQQVTTP